MRNNEIFTGVCSVGNWLEQYALHSDVLGPIYQKFSLVRKLNAELSSFLGNQNEKNAEVINWEKNTLTIVVYNAALASILRFKQAEIIQHFRKTLVPQLVSIRWRVLIKDVQ